MWPCDLLNIVLMFFFKYMCLLSVSHFLLNRKFIFKKRIFVSQDWNLPCFNVSHLELFSCYCLITSLGVNFHSCLPSWRNPADTVIISPFIIEPVKRTKLTHPCYACMLLWYLLFVCLKKKEKGRRGCYSNLSLFFFPLSSFSFFKVHYHHQRRVVGVNLAPSWGSVRAHTLD